MIARQLRGLSYTAIKFIFYKNTLFTFVKSKYWSVHDQKVKPPLWRPIFRHHSFGSKLGTKIVEKTLTWHCCMCCNPANGRVDFMELSAYNIELHDTEWIVSLSANWDRRPKKNRSVFLVRKPDLNILLSFLMQNFGPE